MEKRFEDGSIVLGRIIPLRLLSHDSPFIDGPLRQKTCVRHEERPLAVMEADGEASPLILLILCRQHILNRVFWPDSDDVFCDSE